VAGIRKAEGEVMYTVIRFTIDSLKRDEIASIGVSMNTLRAGIFTGLRKAGDGFACEVCADASWEVHVREILQFAIEFGEFIERALRLGASITVDTAVEPEDRESAGGVLVLACTPTFLTTMASSGLRMELSVY
jgi:hypothetical protein